jgi:hypothetical protein
MPSPFGEFYNAPGQAAADAALEADGRLSMPPPLDWRQKPACSCKCGFGEQHADSCAIMQFVERNDQAWFDSAPRRV